MKTLLFAAWLSAGTADATTSHLALAQPGMQEANPTMLSQPWANTGLQAGYLTGSLYAYERYYDRHPKLMTAIAIGVTTAHTYAAIHNAQTLQGRR